MFSVYLADRVPISDVLASSSLASGDLASDVLAGESLLGHGLTGGDHKWVVHSNGSRQSRCYCYFYLFHMHHSSAYSIQVRSSKNDNLGAISIGITLY